MSNVVEKWYEDKNNVDEKNDSVMKVIQLFSVKNGKL